MCLFFEDGETLSVWYNGMARRKKKDNLETG